MNLKNINATTTRKYVLVLFLLGIYLFSSICGLKMLSLNSDEGTFFGYGIKILTLNPEKDNHIFLYHSKMPVCAFNVLPRAVEQLLNPGLKKSEAQSFSDYYHGRFISVLIGLLVAIYIFKWSKELYGFNAGCFSLFLCCLSPDLIAHSQFISTDIYAAFFSIALFYHTWRFVKEKSNKHLILLAIFLALCQVAKQSLLFYYFLIPLLLLISCFSDKSKAGRNLEKGMDWKNIIWKLLLVIGINLLIINAAFLFYRTGMPLNEYHFISQSFQKMQESAGFWGNIPIPLPKPFFIGMDGAKYYEQLGGGSLKSSFPDVYLLGKAKQNGAFWYYYFVVLFFKLTIPFLIGLLIASFRILKLRRSNEFKKNELFIIAPVIVSLILFDFFYKAQVGIRHILFIIPLLQVMCGICLYKLPVKINKQLVYYMAPFIVWQAVSVMRYFPHFLPYTNEFILNKKNAYKYLADSNIFYREGDHFLKEYLLKHPGTVYSPGKPVAGNIVININDYLNLWNTGQYNWLKQLHKEPVDDIDSQYLIFNTTRQDILSLSQ